MIKMIGWHQSPDLRLKGEDMEIWDGYTVDKQLAGVDIIREEEFTREWSSLGLYHLVSDIIVRHSDGTWLVMQRDFAKEGHPGEWELGAGGSVLKGESAYQGAVRELYEETGIASDELTLLKEITTVHSNGVGVHYSIYLCETDVSKTAIKLQAGETVDFKWLTDDEIREGAYIPDRSRDLILQLMEEKDAH